ncbi:MAG: hypothetical protein QF662_05440 [Phycisphaerae bacterium]|nr:hypothetical protein [Phycisphaerae bacterium]
MTLQEGESEQSERPESTGTIEAARGSCFGPICALWTALRLLVLAGIIVLAVYAIHQVGIGKSAGTGQARKGAQKASSRDAGKTAPRREQPRTESSPASRAPSDVEQMRDRMSGLLGGAAPGAALTGPVPKDLPVPPGGKVIMSTHRPEEAGGADASMVVLRTEGTAKGTIDFFVHSHAKAGWERMRVPPRRKGKSKGIMLVFARGRRARAIYIKQGATESQILIAVYGSRH